MIVFVGVSTSVWSALQILTIDIYNMKVEKTSRHPHSLDMQVDLEPDSRLWQRVKMQHGLLDWTLRELYGIPSTGLSPCVDTPLAIERAARQLRTWVCVRNLTCEPIISIFLVQLDRSRSASMLAREFGVTVRTVRDVWSQKSRHETTSPYLLLPWKAGDHLPPSETGPLAIAAAERVGRAMDAAAHARLEITLLLDEQKIIETPKKKRKPYHGAEKEK